MTSLQPVPRRSVRSVGDQLAHAADRPATPACRPGRAVPAGRLGVRPPGRDQRLSAIGQHQITSALSLASPTNDDPSARPLRRFDESTRMLASCPTSAGRPKWYQGTWTARVAATTATATIDRRIRRHSAASAKPDRATNGTYGDPAATTRARRFDSGRVRTTSVTTENARAATASAVSSTRGLPDKRRHALPVRLQLIAGYQSTSDDAARRPPRNRQQRHDIRAESVGPAQLENGRQEFGNL